MMHGPTYDACASLAKAQLQDAYWCFTQTYLYTHELHGNEQLKWPYITALYDMTAHDSA